MVMLAVVVLSGALPAGAAQSEEAVPTGFTGRALLGSCEEASGRGEFVDGVDQLRDYACPDGWMRTTDPRFTGTYTVVGNYDTHYGTVGALEDGSLMVATLTRRVENDAGLWEANPSVEAWWSPESEDAQTESVFPRQTVVFIGEGGYEGLTAVVWLNPFIVPSELWGVIFTGQPPQTPTDAR